MLRDCSPMLSLPVMKPMGTSFEPFNGKGRGMGNVSNDENNSEYDAHERERPGSLGQLVRLARGKQRDKT